MVVSMLDKDIAKTLRQFQKEKKTIKAKVKQFGRCSFGWSSLMDSYINPTEFHIVEVFYNRTRKYWTVYMIKIKGNNVPMYQYAFHDLDFLSLTHKCHLPEWF